MGFDIECIINIQSYPGEYFCPVCRTLVYPNEVFQTQCTHLYCKPCLSHVANTTKACPYDGYLVTEADSKPLIESNKALAENIGKVKVHCLYHRSGCTWEGILSESSSHCSGCTFGNSSVICNRCGIQITHNQVHDHAQTCPGAYQAPETVDANQNAASSTVKAATTYQDQNQTVALSGPSTSQAQISQTSAAPLPSGQASNQQANASSQTAAVAPSATPTPDQWYQQQYYQQYAGYNPYQQSYQQYYPYAQQPGQAYQQGQYNSQAYVQPQPQPQAQAHFQTYPVPQVPTQPQPSQQPQPQSQKQEKVTQPSVTVQGTNPLQSHVQAAASQYQQVNPQQQFSSSQQPHPQGNAALHSQPHSQQFAPPQVQVPGYQQPVQSTHPAVPSQNNQPSQPQNLHQPQIHSQHHLHNQSLPYSQQYPPQINHPPVQNAQPHASHSANALVTGHHSYQPPPQIPVGPPHALHSHVVTGSLPVHGHIQLQPHSARPPLSHGLVANQPKPAVPTHMPSNHPTQPQQLHPHAQVSVVQHHPGIQSVQTSMTQQTQAFYAPLQGKYNDFGQQQPLQSQLHPHSTHQVMQPGAHGYNLSQQNTSLGPGFIPQRPQSFGAQPSMPGAGGFGPNSQNKPAPLGSSRSSGDNNFASQEADALGQVNGQKYTNVRTNSVELKDGNMGTRIKMDKEGIEETREGSGSSRIVVNDTDKESQLVMQQTVKEEPTGEFSDTPSARKSLGASAEENIGTGVREEMESVSNQKEAFTAKRDLQSTNLGASNVNGSDKFDDPLKSQSLHSSGLRPQAPGFSPTLLKGERSDHLPPHAPISGFPGPGSTAAYGRGRGMFGPPPRSFGLHPGAPQTPALPGLPPDSVDPRSGMMGRALVSGPEGPLGHGSTGMDPSVVALRDDRFNFQAGEHVNHFSMEPVLPFDRDGTVGPPSRFMPPPIRPDIVPVREPQFGINDGFRGKTDPSRAADFFRPNPGYGRNHGMPPHDREYLDMPPREPRTFGTRPRPFNLPPDSVGGSVHEDRFPGLPSNMQRIEHGGIEHLGYNEHIAPGHRHNRFPNRDPFDEEFLPGRSRRGDMSGPHNFPGPFHPRDAAGFGSLPGGGRMREMVDGFPHHFPGRESFRGNFPDFPRPGEPGFRSNYSRQGFSDDRFFADELSPFDKSRKRKPVSMGWCRICKIDCESVEELDMHSQTREHQRMAMEMVKSIKQQNKKKSKIPGEHAPTLKA